MMKTLISGLLSLALVGCGSVEDDVMGNDEVSPPHEVIDGKYDSSLIASVLDFEWDGEVTTDFAFSNEQVIRDQLLYTIGHLNEHNSVGRLDRLTLTNVRAASENGRTRITYHAKMPVAWGSKTNLPTRYEFTLPVDASFDGTSRFTSKYNTKCIDLGAHDVDQGSMWYYYRPGRSGCRLEAADVVKTTATVTFSSSNTTGMYPEYDKVWEDGTLNVVAVFGKYEDGATTSSDAGIAAYNEFVGAVGRRLRGLGTVTTTPSSVPSSPGIGTPDITFDAVLADGRKVQVVALLVDNVRTTDPRFNTRYEQLSTRADLIAYNGHAGLGDNVRALARKGKWVAGQYVIVFMNGCDTFAYVDGSLAQTRAAINPDDPTGTKYMEFVTNAMPSFFHEDSEASMALINGLLSYQQPLTYEQMFRDIDPDQVVLVTGEHDNTFRPVQTGGLLDETASVTRGEMLNFSVDVTPGTYLIALDDDPAHRGGDADLYVRRGQAPTMAAYDCRPYSNGNKETCSVRVEQPQKLFVSVHGYAARETFFTLKAVRQ